MNDPLLKALDALLRRNSVNAEDDQRLSILTDMLWKMVRKDWHGVSDCANDLRELRL